MHESPKLEIGNFSIPYNQLIAWCDPGDTYELVYRDEKGSIKTTDASLVYLSTETREKIAKHLDENAKQTDAKIPKELELLINSLPNKQQIPRCNQHYLHIDQGSFPLRHIKDWSIDKNCSGEWLQLDFTTEFIRTRFYIRSEKVPTEIIDQLKTAWFLKHCLEFSSNSRALHQKIEIEILSRVVNHSIALTNADRFYKHMIRSSNGTEYIKGIQLLCELINHLSNLINIKEPSTNEIWDKITEATFDKVERDLNESIKNLKSIQQQNPQSDSRYSFYSYYLQKVENHLKVFKGKNKNDLCLEYIKLNLFIEKLVSFQNYSEIMQWCLSETQQLIVDLVLQFSKFETNEENLESILLELDINIHLCKNHIKASQMREHKTGIVHHFQQRVKKYPKMYETDQMNQMKLLCQFADRCCYLIQSQNYTAEEIESQLDSLIKEYKLNKTPADILQELLKKLEVLSFGDKQETLTDYYQRILTHSKQISSDDEIYQLYQFVTECLNSDTNDNQLQSKLKELNLCLPLPREKLNSLLETFKTELDDNEAKIIYRCQVLHQYHCRISSHPTTNAEEINKLCLLTEKCIKMIDHRHRTAWCCEQIDNYIKELKLELFIDEYNESLAMLNFRIKSEKFPKDRVYFEYYKQKLISYQHPDISNFIYHCLHDCYFLWFQECARYVLDEKIKELQLNPKLQTLLKKLEDEFFAHSTLFRHQVLRKYHYRIINHPTDNIDECTKLISLIEKCFEMFNATSKMTYWCCEQIDNHIKELKLNFVIDQYNELHHVLDFRIKYESNFVTKTFNYYKQQITQHQQPEVLEFVNQCLETVAFNWGPEAKKLLDDGINEIELKSLKPKFETLLKKFENQFTTNTHVFRHQVLRKYHYRIIKHAADTNEEIKKLISLIEKCLEFFDTLKYQDTLACCLMIDNHIKDLKLNFVIDQYNELHHVLDYRMKSEWKYIVETLKYYKQQITQHQQPEVLTFVLQCLENLTFNWGPNAQKLLDDKINEIELKSLKLKLETLLKKFEYEFEAFPTLFRRQVLRKYHYRIINHAADTNEEIKKLISLIEKCLELFDIAKYSDTYACCEMIDEHIEELGLKFVIDQCNELHHLLDFRMKGKLDFIVESCKYYKEQINKHPYPEVLAFVNQCLENLIFDWSESANKLLDDKINEIVENKLCALLKQFENELKRYPLVVRYQKMRTYQSRILTLRRSKSTDITKLPVLIQKCIDLLDDKCSNDSCFKQIDNLIKDLNLNLIQTSDEQFDELMHFLDDRINQQFSTTRMEALSKFKQQINQHKLFIQQQQELYTFIHICLDQMDYRKDTDWCEKTLNQKIKDIKITLLNFDLSQLSNLNKGNSLAQWYHDKIVEKIKDIATIEQSDVLGVLDKLTILVGELKRASGAIVHQTIDAKVKELQLDFLCTSDCFWTGVSMIPTKKIVAFYQKNALLSLIVEESPNKLEIINTMSEFSSEIRDRLIKELEKNQQWSTTNNRVATAMKKLAHNFVPFATDSGYLHLYNFSVPLRFIKENSSKDFLAFSEDFLWNYKTIDPRITDGDHKKISDCLTLMNFVKSVDQNQPLLFDDIVDQLNQSYPLEKINRISTLISLYTKNDKLATVISKAIKKQESTDFDLKKGDLLNYYYSHHSGSTNPEIRLKLELLVIYCTDILDKSLCPFKQHQATEEFIGILGLESPSSTDCFWTGTEMIPFNKIVAWRKRPYNEGTKFIIRQDTTDETETDLKVCKTKMNLSAEAKSALFQGIEKCNQPTDSLSLAIQRLISLACPWNDTSAFTFAYFNTESGAFPWKHIITIDRTWLKVQGFPNIVAYVLPQSEVSEDTTRKIHRCICIHHLMNLIKGDKGLTDEQRNEFILRLENISPPISTESVMSAVSEIKKLIDKLISGNGEQTPAEKFDFAIIRLDNQINSLSSDSSKRPLLSGYKQRLIDHKNLISDDPTSVEFTKMCKLVDKILDENLGGDQIEFQFKRARLNIVTPKLLERRILDWCKIVNSQNLIEEESALFKLYHHKVLHMQTNISDEDITNLCLFVDRCCQVFQTKESVSWKREQLELKIRELRVFEPAYQKINRLIQYLDKRIGFQSPFYKIRNQIVECRNGRNQKSTSDFEILKLCKITQLIIDIIDCNLSSDESNKQIDSMIKELNLFLEPDERLQHLLTCFNEKLDAHLPDLKRGILRLYKTQAQQNQQIPAVDKCYYIGKLIDMIDSDLSADECNEQFLELSEFSELNPTPRQKINELLSEFKQTLKLDISPHKFMGQYYELINYRLKSASDEEILKLTRLTLKCFEAMDDGNHFFDYHLRQIETLIGELGLFKSCRPETLKESICAKEFTCQLFIVLCKEANETFETIAQKIITEVGDKGKPHFLLFEEPGNVDWLWVSVDGMCQSDLNSLYEKLFGSQKEYIRSNKYEHTAHISPSMLRNSKPFEFNVVPIEKDASFFINGDSASDWDNLHERLIQEIPECQSLLFSSRKRGRAIGHTLYVRTKRMKFSSPHQLLQKIDTNNDFIILDKYTTEMIETIIKTWKHNDIELVKEFSQPTTQQ